MDRVFSLATAPAIRNLDGDIHLGDVMDDRADVEVLRREVLGNPLYAGTLVSSDSTATAMLVHLEPMTDREFVRSGVDAEIDAIARSAGYPGRVWISGFPHFQSAMSATMKRQLGRIMPMVLAILALVLAFTYRSVRGVAVPMLTVILAVIWTAAAIVLMGGVLNISTVIVPPLVLILGFAYTVHVMSDYYRTSRESHEPANKDSSAMVCRTMGEVGLPVLLTGLTTGAGFSALAAHPIPGIHMFGLYALVGVSLATIASLTVTPACLALLRPPRAAALARQRGILEALAEPLGRFATRRRRLVIGTYLLFFAVSLVAATQVHIAARFHQNFKPGAPVRVDYEAINERLGGASSIHVLLETEATGGVMEPEHLRAMRDFQDWLEAQPEVGSSRSIADYVMLLNRAFDGELRVPDSRELARQLLWLGGSEQSAAMIDAEHRTANLTAMSTVGDSGTMRGLVERIDARLGMLPESLKAGVTGHMVLVSQTLNTVARGQWISLGLAFSTIYLMLLALFRSFRIASLALFANAVPIAAYFGALGLTGVPLNNSTGMVGSMALGIAVDDTIHFFTRFGDSRVGDPRKASVETLSALIRPVTVTSFALCASFLLFATSELRSHFYFGTFASFALAVAWLTDVTLSPALCAGGRRTLAVGVNDPAPDAAQ